MGNRVLIYDDDNDILFTTRYILEKAGYTVETKSICADIVRDTLDLEPDLLLVDYRMPGVGGVKAIALLKKNLSTKNIPVLLFSAFDHLEDLTKQAEADGYIQKPFDMNEFLQTIEQALAYKTGC